MILSTEELKKLARRIKPVNERLYKINTTARVTVNTDVNLELNGITLCYFDCFNPDDMKFLSLDIVLEIYNGVQIMPLLIEFYTSVRDILENIKEDKFNDRK